MRCLAVPTRKETRCWLRQTYGPNIITNQAERKMQRTEGREDGNMDTEDVGASEEDIAEALAENDPDCVDTVDDAESTLDALVSGADEEGRGELENEKGGWTEEREKDRLALVAEEEVAEETKEETGTDEVDVGEEDVAEPPAENDPDCVETVDDVENALDALVRGEEGRRELENEKGGGWTEEREKDRLALVAEEEADKTYTTEDTADLENEVGGGWIEVKDRDPPLRVIEIDDTDDVAESENDVGGGWIEDKDREVALPVPEIGSREDEEKGGGWIEERDTEIVVLVAEEAEEGADDTDKDPPVPVVEMEAVENEAELEKEKGGSWIDDNDEKVALPVIEFGNPDEVEVAELENDVEGGWVEDKGSEVGSPVENEGELEEKGGGWIEDGGADVLVLITDEADEEGRDVGGDSMEEGMVPKLYMVDIERPDEVAELENEVGGGCIEDKDGEVTLPVPENTDEEEKGERWVEDREKD
ncbi:hypothetical protein C8R44DRAFT_924636 [Mycena epipterygia]|nr:hypothetical protein C8R44DRAFT_924636 [Mycena epipterygia]